MIKSWKGKKEMNHSLRTHIKTSISLLAMAFSLSACAKSSSPSSENTTTETHSAPVGEESYEAYYRKFLFEPQTCMKDYPRYYKFASSNGVSLLASNKKLRVSVTAYLFANNTYQATLLLLKPRPDINDYTYEHLENHELVGMWSVQDDKLKLEGLGVGHALTYNERLAVDLEIETPVSDGKFNRSGTILTMATSSSVPQELEVGCK